MNIQQLRCVCEVVRHDLNVSRAAASLHASQPAVSTQIHRLEAELGFEIFVRRRNRLTALTANGKAIFERAKRALLEIEAIQEIRREHLRDDTGTLVVAASHGQSRNVLPAAMKRFSRRFPKVEVTVRHGTRKQIADMLLGGEAHVGLTSDVSELGERLLLLPCHRYRRILLVPRNHPLLKQQRPTLAALAEYPFVMYGPSGSAGPVATTFAERGVELRQILFAPNSDVMKAYVEQGLGITALAEFMFDARRDKSVRAIDASHLFPPSVTYLLLVRKQYLRSYTYALLEEISPRLTRAMVEEAIG